MVLNFVSACASVYPGLPNSLKLRPKNGGKPSKQFIVFPKTKIAGYPHSGHQDLAPRRKVLTIPAHQSAKESQPSRHTKELYAISHISSQSTRRLLMLRARIEQPRLRWSEVKVSEIKQQTPKSKSDRQRDRNLAAFSVVNRYLASQG